jgi:RNA polymerase sigma-70 factor (ECF subfamily)
VDFFSCLYERYEERMLRYIKRIAHLSADEAEDILQEAFIKIWKNLNAFDQNLKLSSWIYRIVHNHTISYLRKKYAYGQVAKVEWNEKLEAFLPGERTDEWAEFPENSIATDEILSSLPLSFKEVLVLKFLENMSYEEISDVLKIPEGTVATRINRAKKAFRKLAAAQQPIL